MHYLWIIVVHFSTNYHLSVYDMAYSYLVDINTGIVIVADKGEYRPPKKIMELESNLSLKLPITRPGT